MWITLLGKETFSALVHCQFDVQLIDCLSQHSITKECLPLLNPSALPYIQSCTENILWLQPWSNKNYFLCIASTKLCIILEISNRSYLCLRISSVHFQQIFQHKVGHWVPRSFSKNFVGDIQVSQSPVRSKIAMLSKHNQNRDKPHIYKVAIKCPKFFYISYSYRAYFMVFLAE